MDSLILNKQNNIKLLNLIVVIFLITSSFYGQERKSPTVSTKETLFDGSPKTFEGHKKRDSLISIFIHTLPENEDPSNYNEFGILQDSNIPYAEFNIVKWLDNSNFKYSPIDGINIGKTLAPNEQEKSAKYIWYNLPRSIKNKAIELNFDIEKIRDYLFIEYNYGSEFSKQLALYDLACKSINGTINDKIREEFRKKLPLDANPTEYIMYTESYDDENYTFSKISDYLLIRQQKAKEQRTKAINDRNKNLDNIKHRLANESKDPTISVYNSSDGRVWIRRSQYANYLIEQNNLHGFK